MFEPMVWILIFFIGASLLLYVVLGGADYGAGILELLPSGKYRERQKELINNAMGPVWEANHIWLILIVVILFMGFPGAFQILMTSLHLPMVALLLGIVVRGTAFTFRHYDAIQEPRSQRVYTVLFGVSSLWTSLWLGVIAASLFRGKIDLESSTFWEAYVAPWWGLFPFTMGVFVAFIFAYLASMYLIGETDEPELKRFFRKRAFVFNILIVLGGALVFVTSYYDGEHLLPTFIKDPFSIGCVVTATLLFGVLWLTSARRQTYLIRICAAGQVALILMGWYFVRAPNVVATNSDVISFFDAAAPEATLKQLCLALLIGSLFIFPSLYFLLRVFKGHTVGESE